MPWNEYNYPASMKNLPVEVRNKAIEIANALFEKGNMDEGIIIATAIKHAKEWAEKGKRNGDNAKTLLFNAGSFLHTLACNEDPSMLKYKF